VTATLRGLAGARVNGITVTGVQNAPVNNSTENAAHEAVANYRSSRVAVRVVPQPTHATAMDSRSKLNYVDMVIRGIHGIHTALHDNGSEINLVDRQLIEQLSNLPAMGRIKIKGVVGPAVETDLTMLDISPTASEPGVVNIAPPLREIFAVCDGLNENVILTADTVRRLATLKDYESFVATTVANETTTSVDEVGGLETTAQNGDTETVESENQTEVDSTCDDKVSETNRHGETDPTSADTVTLIKEQYEDPTELRSNNFVCHGIVLRPF